jgi:hypothetical protein
MNGTVGAFRWWPLCEYTSGSTEGEYASGRTGVVQIEGTRGRSESGNRGRPDLTMSSNPYGPVVPSRARWVSSARWLYGYALDLDYWLDLMRKRNIGGCPSDADDMLAISKMKAFFWQCSRLGPHQLELDVAWEGGETCTGSGSSAKNARLACPILSFCRPAFLRKSRSTSSARCVTLRRPRRVGISTRLFNIRRECSSEMSATPISCFVASVSPLSAAFLLLALKET